MYSSDCFWDMAGFSGFTSETYCIYEEHLLKHGAIVCLGFFLTSGHLKGNFRNCIPKFSVRTTQNRYNLLLYLPMHIASLIQPALLCLQCGFELVSLSTAIPGKIKMGPCCLREIPSHLRRSDTGCMCPVHDLWLSSW